MEQNVYEKIGGQNTTIQDFSCLHQREKLEVDNDLAFVKKSMPWKFFMRKVKGAVLGNGTAKWAIYHRLNDDGYCKIPQIKQ